MSCVVSVAGICSSDDGLKISPSQNAQTPPYDKHVGHGNFCLYLKFLIHFNMTALFYLMGECVFLSDCVSFPPQQQSCACNQASPQDHEEACSRTAGIRKSSS